MPSCTRISLALLLTALPLVGCSGSKPNPASSNISFGPDDRFANRVLDDAEARKVLEIMRESVDGPADAPAHPAPYGVRWADVGLAATRAGGKLELAIQSVEQLDGGDTKKISMVSIGDVPVELLVRRVPPPKIYEATVTAGLFDDQVTLAAALLRQFNESMRLYGAKPSWPPLKNE